jgi:hypothetical protein
MSKIGLALVRVASGVVVAVALMVPVNALASVSGLQITGTELNAKGVEVDVAVMFTCDAGDIVPSSAFLQGLTVSLQESISKTEQASGVGSGSQVACTGSPQPAVIQVLANASGPAFRIGSAIANLSVTECTPDFFTCSGASTGFVTVRLTN